MQKLKQFQLVINPGLLLTTWLISTTSPEQQDEHQPHKQSFYKQKQNINTKAKTKKV